MGGRLALSTGRHSSRAAALLLLTAQIRLYLTSSSLVVEDRSDVPASSSLVVGAILTAACVTPPLPSVPEPERLAWTFCYTEAQTSGDAAGYGPFSFNFVGQLTTQNVTSVSPVSGLSGYRLTSARGNRVQLNRNGVLTRNAIIGLGWVVAGTTEQGYDPFLYTSVAPNKTAPTPATLSAQGVLFALDNAPILPNGYQTNRSVTAAVYEVGTPLARTRRLPSIAR